jgi:hypothetical protein
MVPKPRTTSSIIKMCLHETYSKIHSGKHLSDAFPIQNGLKQGDTLSLLLSNFALEYAMRKKTEERMELNGTHQILFCADDVNLLGGNINITNKKTEIILDASEEIVLEVNVEKTRYVFISCYQTAG